VRLAARDAPPTATTVIAAAGSFAAIAALFGSPLLSAFLMLEAAGIGGPMLGLVLLPGLLAAGIGELVFVGLDSLTGFGTFSLAIPNLPPFGHPTGAMFLWAIVFGVVAAFLGVASSGSRGRSGPRGAPDGPAHARPRSADRRPGHRLRTGHGQELLRGPVLGQSALPGLVGQSAQWSVGALLLLVLCKSLAYALSLSSFRGGPVFPALFIGAAAGIAAHTFPASRWCPAVAMGIGAMCAAMLGPTPDLDAARDRVARHGRPERHAGRDRRGRRGPRDVRAARPGPRAGGAGAAAAEPCRRPPRHDADDGARHHRAPRGLGAGRRRRAGPFVTSEVLRAPDGSLVRWRSRLHRKGAPGRAAASGGARTASSWWMALLFAIGSLCFALAAFVSQWASAPRPAIGVTFFVGSIFFTWRPICSSARPSTSSTARCAVPRACGGGPPRGSRDGSTGWHRPSSSPARLFFNVSTFAGMKHGFDARQSDLRVWTPDVFGSICFLVSSELAYAEVCHRWVCLRARSLSWRIVTLNLVGSIAFGVSAVASLVEPSTQEPVSAAIANAGTTVGALCFLAGAILLPLEAARTG
jgi:hypothetical protein